jgi:hypothetical protein
MPSRNHRYIIRGQCTTHSLSRLDTRRKRSESITIIIIQGR